MIYLGRPITEALKCLGEDYNENKSGRISTVCERYLMIVSDEIRRMNFSRAEWLAILDANNGVTVSYGIPEVGAMLWAKVQEARSWTRSGGSTGARWSRRCGRLVRRGSLRCGRSVTDSGRGAISTQTRRWRSQVSRCESRRGGLGDR